MPLDSLHGTMLYAYLPYRPCVASLLGLLLVTTAACAQNSRPQNQNPDPSLPPPTAPYAFDQPNALFTLPSSLEEISGLTVLDEQTLGAIQDEKGRLYVINLNTGTVEDDPAFDENGDYEDLARVGDRVFVLRSDGTLFEIHDWRAEKLETTRHKTPLSPKYDTEGLVYDPAHARLLIACKEYAGKGRKDQKVIFAFDLENNQLVDEPVFTIDGAAFNEQVEQDDGLSERIRRALEPAVDLSGFKPSALALHPVTGALYVLSSVRQVIVVLSPDGAMAAVWSLPENLFRQPEGMTFLPNGDLFIASEGDGKEAVLARFNFQP